MQCACDCGNSICNQEQAFGRFRFEQNSEDLFFGDSTALGFSDLRITASNEETVFITITDSVIGFTLRPDILYTIQVGRLDTLLISADLFFEEETECCSIYGLSAVRVDGEEVCSGLCDPVTISL